LTGKFVRFEQKLFAGIFAKGLAAAAIAQIVILNNVENASVIANVTYSVIWFTILLSSIMIFIAKRSFDVPEEVPLAPEEVVLPPQENTR
jgi:NhaP-type Na+/H+ and K+/H+ antiporter